MIYLDTHVLVWIYGEGTKQLSDSAIHLIEQERDIRISPMARLELEYLYEIERVSEPAITVLDSLETAIGIALCSAPFSAIVKAAEKIHWTRDPFDRLIVAHASLFDARLVTRDQNIQQHYEHAFW